LDRSWTNLAFINGHGPSIYLHKSGSKASNIAKGLSDTANLPTAYYLNLFRGFTSKNWKYKNLGYGKIKIDNNGYNGIGTV
jgi:hypothetical protein